MAWLKMDRAYLELLEQETKKPSGSTIQKVFVFGFRFWFLFNFSAWKGIQPSNHYQ